MRCVVPYRKSAGKRKNVEVVLDLSDKEVSEAILDFLEAKEILPNDVERKSVKIEVFGGWENSNWKNKCKVSFYQRVLTLTDS